MIFEEEYFKEENIEGFHVRSMMKRYWAAHMEMLDELGRVCDELGITYYADYGTLLGAVRHNGFIPWDDDVDVSMLRGDYEKFRIYADSHFSDGIMIFNNCKTALAPMRIVNTIAPSLTPDFLTRFHGCPYPAGIDIYPIDRLPKRDKDKEVFRALLDNIKYLAQRFDKQYMSEEEQANYQNDGHTEASIEAMICKIEELTDTKIDRAGNMAVQMTELLNSVQGKYWNGDNDELVYLHGWTRGARIPMSYDVYGTPVDLLFGKTHVKAPINYDAVLRERFGDDYMTPVFSGAGHGYPAYKKSQQTLLKVFEQCGVTPPPEYME